MAKKMAVFLVALLLAALFAGCTPFTSQNVNDLLRAPTLTPGQDEIQAALKAYLGGVEPQYKYPRGGSTLSPLLRADLNGDGQQEAILLYSLPEGATTRDKANYVNVAVLEHTSGEWVVTYTEQGLYTDVASIEVADLLGDATRQLLVGYATAGLNAKMLALYTYDAATLTQQDTFDYSLYEIGDFTGSGGNDLLVVSRGDQAGGLQLYYVSARDGRFVKDTQTEPVPLDVNFDACAAITPGVISGGDQAGERLLVVDGVSKNALSSEFVYYTTTPTERFFTLSDSNPLRGAAGRKNLLLTSRDIDGDGVVEIPLRVGSSELTTPQGDKHLEFIEWMDFTASVSEPQSKQFGLLDSDRGVYVRLPESWRNTVRVADGSGAGEWLVQDRQTMATLLSLHTVADDTPQPGLLPVPGTASTYLQLHSGVKAGERDLITMTSLTGF